MVRNLYYSIVPAALLTLWVTQTPNRPNSWHKAPRTGWIVFEADQRVPDFRSGSNGFWPAGKC